MTQIDSEFVRLSRDVLNGSYPYGFDPGQAASPEEFAVVLVHDLEPCATVVLAVRRDQPPRCALCFRNTTIQAVDRITKDFQSFMEEMHYGVFGEMLPFSFLPRRVALRRLKRLVNAN